MPHSGHGLKPHAEKGMRGDLFPGIDCAASITDDSITFDTFDGYLTAVSLTRSDSDHRCLAWTLRDNDIATTAIVIHRSGTVRETNVLSNPVWTEQVDGSGT
jgi:hypothetical protein